MMSKYSRITNTNNIFLTVFKKKWIFTFSIHSVWRIHSGGDIYIKYVRAKPVLNKIANMNSLKSKKKCALLKSEHICFSCIRSKTLCLSLNSHVNVILDGLNVNDGFGGNIYIFIIFIFINLKILSLYTLPNI